VPDLDDVLLAALVPADAVVHGRRHQEQHADRGHQRARVEHYPVELRRPAEARRERRREQEPEQHLRSGQGDAELVQQLDQLPVGLLLLRLGHE